MQLDCGTCIIRAWRCEDETQLVAVANDEEVSRYMTDVFPHPYRREDARSWIHFNSGDGATNFAIVTNDAIAGGIGYRRLSGENRFTAEWGYWLGRRYWGRGIGTSAARVFVEYIFEHSDLERLQAHVSAPNVASMRVLEKCGHMREGTLRRAVYKAGIYYDLAVFGLTRDMR
ncbi:MAG: GNAT family N-acetyltransferase [Candidatus Eremiobacteraeota bacterium]|nr:GNAT family N-acetyltransferase [Candidatus Eremiobacteraeota bacterium]